MRKYAINCALFGLIGFTMGHYYMTPNDWGFWVVLLSVLLVRINDQFGD